MLRLARTGKNLSSLQRPYGWFWGYPDRLLFIQKGVVWFEWQFTIRWEFYYHIKAEILKTWKCCKIIYRDGIWYAKKKTRMIFQDEPITLKEKHKMTTTKIDLMKMIPFSFFIIIPGAELLLPLCLYLFPNMVPSSFISKTKEEKNIIHLLDARNVYADAIHQYMLKQLREQKDESIENFNRLLRFNPQNLSKKICIEYHDFFPKYFGFAKMDHLTLINVCRLLTMEPWTGFKVFGKLLFDPYYKIRGWLNKKPYKDIWAPDNIVSSTFSKYLLILQLKMYLKRIREDDYLLLVEDIREIEQENLIKCCRERGIETENTTNYKIDEDVLDWTKNSTHPLKNGKVSNEFMVLTQIFPYLQDEVYVDDDRNKVEPSDERETKLNKQISMKKLYDFNERMVYRIMDKVHISSPYYFHEEVRADYIEKLKQTLDGKHMPEDDEEIKDIIKQLESVAPKTAVQQGPSMSK